MLPKTTTRLPTAIRVTQQPSRTFRMDLENKQIIGYTDGLDAVAQTVYCILNTERYEYLIYSWNHGVELRNLIGRPLPYVKSELKRRITEALTQDDRINSVDTFSFETAGKKLSVSFSVYTTLGDLTQEMEVEV